MIDVKPTWFLGALLLGALAPAQQKTEQPPSEPSTAQQEFKELTEGFNEARRSYYQEAAKAAAEAKAAGKATPALNMAGPTAEWLPKFQAGAQKYKGTEGAVPFLIWVGNNVQGPDRDTVLTTLLQDHIESPAMTGALRLITSDLQMAKYKQSSAAKGVDGETEAEAKARQAEADKQVALADKRVRETLAKVIAKNPNRDVQAQALLARANLVLEARQEPGPDAAARNAALTDVRDALARAESAQLKAQLEGIIYEQEHLQVGMAAPEIEGNDLDGVAFKLSDYRGKVVLLDFWGYW